MKSELLKELWENDDFILAGIQADYRQEIDRDQAIDESGKACYKSYALKYLDEYHEFTAEEIEEFSRTW